MAKLLIEMHLAEMLSMIIRKSNANRNVCGTADGWHPADNAFNRERRPTRERIFHETRRQSNASGKNTMKGRGVDDGGPEEERLEEAEWGLDEQVSIPCRLHQRERRAVGLVDVEQNGNC